MHSESLQKAGLIENRRFPRTSVIWSGTLESNDEKYDVIAINLSANGAMVRLAQPLDNHASSWILTIPRLGTFNAQLAWRATDGGTDIGLMFHNPPVTVAQQLAEVLSKPEDTFISLHETT